MIGGGGGMISSLGVEPLTWLVWGFCMGVGWAIGSWLVAKVLR